jgi:hypothetical protein
VMAQNCRQGQRQYLKSRTNLERYQACYDEAVIQAEPPCWPNPDVDAGEEGDEAEGKQRDGGANMDL